MKTSIKLGTKLGILGGGQLARMMAFRAQEMGMQVHILCPSADEPAAQVTRHWHQGDPNHAKDLAAFLKHIDCLSFESEFYDAKYIEQVLKENKSAPVSMAPSASILGKLQDRLSQKEILDKYKIPTARYISIQNEKDLEQAQNLFARGFVLKLRTHGYDGKGTWIFHRKSKSTLTTPANLPDLTKQSCIAEEKIQIKRELAVIFVRSSFGEVVQLPLVQSLQKDNRCDLVLGPVHHKDLSRVSKNIIKMLNAEDYVGAIGFEFFDCAQGLIVNEVAPRVHNTGHYSQLALSEDQFSLHVKAVTGLHLQPVKALSKAFAMINLIGAGAETVLAPSDLRGSLHWYGKKDSKVGRKMGHINYIGHTSAELKTLALRERKKFKL